VSEDWDRPQPFVIEADVIAADIDAYGHVNNAIYLGWFDRAAWAHSANLGVPLERCLELRRGMAALHSEIDYVRAAVRGDRVQIATWIVASDRRLRVTRSFQVRRASDAATLARARTDYVCLNLDIGRAVRMPPQFANCYNIAPRD
jgi:acyl-CoA thioester hydrolase